MVDKHTAKHTDESCCLDLGNCDVQGNKTARNKMTQ